MKKLVTRIDEKDDQRVAAAPTLICGLPLPRPHAKTLPARVAAPERYVPYLNGL
jgi:hypothetical protein